jgi:hypothetical protein
LHATARFCSYSHAAGDPIAWHCQIPGCPYVFVHENHPVINLLRINKGMVGVDVDEQQKMDGQWVKVTNSLFDASCDAIKNRILTKIKTHDLNDMTVCCQIHCKQPFGKRYAFAL